MGTHLSPFLYLRFFFYKLNVINQLWKLFQYSRDDLIETRQVDHCAYVSDGQLKRLLYI